MTIPLIRFTIESMPVQAEVRFEDGQGHSLCGLFRSRNDAWTFCAWLGDDESQDPPGNLEFDAFGCWSDRGGFTASHMPHDVARVIIDRCVQLVIEQRDSLVRFQCVL